MDSLEIKSDFKNFKKAFLEENSKLNLISKNDEQYLYEKHIYDSLGIKHFFNKYKPNLKNISVLDIGCGGGFPCVPIAIEYPELNVTGIDSIRKKINSVTIIKEKLNLTNLNLICDRVENLKEQRFDIIISRAVADLSKISEYALPLLKKHSYFIAYKSKKAISEIDSASEILDKYNAKVVDIITYTLPLEDIYERNLIIIKN